MRIGHVLALKLSVPDPCRSQSCQMALDLATAACLCEMSSASLVTPDGAQQCAWHS